MQVEKIGINSNSSMYMNRKNINNQKPETPTVAMPSEDVVSFGSLGVKAKKGLLYALFPGMMVHMTGCGNSVTNVVADSTFPNLVFNKFTQREGFCPISLVKYVINGQDTLYNTKFFNGTTLMKPEVLERPDCYELRTTFKMTPYKKFENPTKNIPQETRTLEEDEKIFRQSMSKLLNDTKNINIQYSERVEKPIVDSKVDLKHKMNYSEIKYDWDSDSEKVIKFYDSRGNQFVPTDLKIVFNDGKEIKCGSYYITTEY